MTLAMLVPAAGGWSMHGGGSGWWMAGMMGFWILFFAAILIGAVWLARREGRGSEIPPRQTPGEILDERFAEGVLSAEDYNARKQLLTGAGSAHEAT